MRHFWKRHLQSRTGLDWSANLFTGALNRRARCVAQGNGRRLPVEADRTSSEAWSGLAMQGPGRPSRVETGYADLMAFSNESVSGI